MPDPASKPHPLQQRIDLLVQLNPLAVIEWNAAFEVITWNPAAERIFGFRKDEVMGRSSLDLIVLEEDREFVRQTIKDLIHHGTGNCSSNQNITKDGRIILCEWYNTPLIDEAGQVIGLVSMAQDITEREQIATTLRQTQKELETRVEERTAELQQSEASYRAILTAIPDLILRIKRDGTYLDFIPAHNFLVCGKPETGMNIRETLPPDLAQLRMHYVEQALQTGEPQVYEHRIELNGRMHTEEIRIVVSGTDEVMGIVRNISDRKRDEADRKQAENKLKASQQILQLVIDNIPQKIFWKDIDCVFLGCNQGFADDVGFPTPKELVGKTDYALPLPKEQIDGYRADDLRIMSSGVAELHVTKPHQMANGRMILIDWSKIPLCDDQGNVVGILGAYEDITERKRAEASLQETLKQTEYQSELLRTVLDTSPDWIFVKDHQFRYLMVNQSFSNALGKTPEMVLGKDDLGLGCAEALVYGDLTQGIQGFHRIDQRVIQGEVFYDPCFPLTTSDGILRIFETKKVPLRDAQGEIFGVLGISRDVTDRHHAEQKLKASQEFLDSILDGIPDPIFVKDAQHRWVLANRAFCEMLGVEREALIGKSDYDVSQKEHADVFWAQDDIVLSTETETMNEEYHSDITGNLRFISTKKICFRDVDGNKFIVGTIRDMSDRKASEEALRQSEAQLRQQTQDLELTLQELQQAQSQLIQSEKMSSLGQLVAGVSHEINNPVGFIYGNLKHATLYTQDLLRLMQLYREQYPEPLPAIQELSQKIELEYLVDDLPKLLNSMKVGADRIQEIVRSLRIFSRMDEAEMKTVDIHEGIDSTLMILQNRLKAQGNRPAIAITKSYGDLPLVECYAGQLNQVFMNILGNGIDALEESMQNEQWMQKNLQQVEQTRESADEELEPLLELCICTALINSEWMRIRIKDNGTGIPEAVRQKLFNPFFTTKPVGKGTGMGLSISYQIITEKHGGSLICLSTVGQGAEFVIEIPVRQPEM
jgi:two-component system, NtrC family, sensor kinase